MRPYIPLLNCRYHARKNPLVHNNTHRNLCDTDILSKSDPCNLKLFTFNYSLVVVSFTDNSWRELDRTEVIQNTLNPDFVKKIVMEYHFEEQQRLNFAVYDVDCSSDCLSKHDFLGNCEATLGEIASSGKIKNVDQSLDELILDFSGRSLDKKDIFGTSDPFLAFYRINEDELSAKFRWLMETVRRKANSLLLSAVRIQLMKC
ncbi:unnamed protein product [Echinostoma caproni]|uniref:C2 domain-containing protein n=1 Tax=Echinostoma caproni TaxID=27848 RepID=A0A183AT27_9TREM|nr:unnamed protein product [Echinostoma caproni]